MKTVGKLLKIEKDLQRNGTKFTIFVEGNILPSLEKLIDQKLNIDLKRWYKKRSLDSNAYMWELLGELQDYLSIPKEELYKEYIRRIGDYETIPVKNIALNKFTRAWKREGLGWFCETTPSRHEGYTNVLAYYGSSSYDNKQMTRLIHEVVDDCRKAGIETRSDADIQSLLNEWSGDK